MCVCLCFSFSFFLERMRVGRSAGGRSPPSHHGSGAAVRNYARFAPFGFNVPRLRRSCHFLSSSSSSAALCHEADAHELPCVHVHLINLRCCPARRFITSRHPQTFLHFRLEVRITPIYHPPPPLAPPLLMWSLRTLRSLALCQKKKSIPLQEFILKHLLMADCLPAPARFREH